MLGGAAMQHENAANGSAKGSLLARMLERLHGKRVVIVMDDERSFKGTVSEFDDKWLYLEDVVEGSALNSRGWQEVTLQTGYVGKRLTAQGVFSEEQAGELVKLKDVMISLDGVLRVWEWEAGNLARPKHVKMEKRNVRF